MSVFTQEVPSIGKALVAVIRGAGERTQEFCLDLLKKQVPSDAIFVVGEVPFEAALHRCYEHGVSSNARWLLTVDADILLLPGGVANLLADAEAMPGHFVQIEGRVFDKVFGVYRPAGVRIYRINLLQHAITQIPQPGEQMRPEFHTLAQLWKLGHPSRRVGTVVGLHDFEQYYRDLYRKAFVHAIKHDYLAIPLIERCLKKQEHDADFSVILKGLFDGHSYGGVVKIDASWLVEQATGALAGLGLSEKLPINNSSASAMESDFLGWKEGEALPMECEDHHIHARRPDRWQRLHQTWNDHGLFGVFRHILAALLLRAWHMLQHNQPAR